MRLVPPIVYKWRSTAEKKIYRQLEKVDLGEHAVALHSLNLSSHRYKQWAEADFVIVTSKGLLVLEVKGGRVSCKDGLWTYTDRYDDEHHSSEGPLVQAKEARFSLEKLLAKKLGHSLIDNLSFGWGAMFPDARFDVTSVEIAPEMVFDAVDYDQKRLGRWVEKLQNYWFAKKSKYQRLEEGEIKSIVNTMRPVFDMVPALISRVGVVYEELVELTNDQYRCLDQLLAQQHNVVEGGAGTGKTFLAVEAARREAEKGKEVLFLCRSRVFGWIISGRLQNTGVRVMNYDALRESVERGEQPKFDLLIVDEGQDFLDLECMEVIDGIVDGGLEKGKWIFFMDNNNQGSLYEHYDEDALEFIKSAGYPFPLYDNCRNTRQIATQTMLYTGGNIGRCRIQGDGLPVNDSNVFSDRDEQVHAIEAQLEQWIDDEEVQPGHITILSPKNYEESVISSIDKRWKRKIFVIDQNFGESWHESSLTYSRVRDFKGLENRYIMLVDLDGLVGSVEDIAMLYVGMTRANAFLWMAIPSGIKPMIDRIRAENATRLAEYLSERGEH